MTYEKICHKLKTSTRKSRVLKPGGELKVIKERTSKILSVIIENYIKIGSPVGSETVCRLMKNPPQEIYMIATNI